MNYLWRFENKFGSPRDRSYIYLVMIKIKVMFEVKQKRGRRDFMGFACFEVFENGKPTGNSYHAENAEDALAMHKQLSKIK